MAELGFYLTYQDKLNFFNYLLSKKFTLIPDLNYNTKSYHEIDNIKGVKPYLRLHSIIFIKHIDYFISPLEMRKIMKDSKEKYYISQRNGGPTIDFYSTSEITKNDMKSIGPGSLSYYSTFWNTKTMQNEKAPSILKTFYHDMSKFIKSISYNLKLVNRNYWISKNVIEKIKDGYMLSNMDKNIIIDFIGNIPPTRSRMK